MQLTGIDELYAIMDQVFGLVNFEYRTDMTAKDIPGWDSLQHTMFMLEIERVTGLELSPFETAALPNLGALWEYIVKAQG